MPSRIAGGQEPPRKRCVGADDEVLRWDYRASQSRESTLTPRIVDRPVGDQVGVLRCCTSDSWLNTKTLADLLIYGDVLASFDCYRDAVSDRTIE